MFICYQYNCMEIVATRQSETLFLEAGLDGKDFKRCFNQLVEGSQSFSVACGNGFMRNLVEYVNDNYIFVKAAGGLVRDANGRLLLMRRNDRWDLPKGKVESGETLSKAAIRETEEETGISNIVLDGLRLKTYHIYNLYGGWHFKQTSWFDMHLEDTSACQHLVPQIEEGITEVGWYDVDDWHSKLDESYATMRIITSQIFGNKWCAENG